MKLIALAVWPIGAVASLVGLVGYDRGTFDGDIVLERAAYCETFVIKTRPAYVIASDEDGWLVALAKANRVTGIRLSKGGQNVGLEDNIRLNINVQGWETKWELARTRFESVCDPGAPTREFRQVASASRIGAGGR